MKVIAILFLICILCFVIYKQGESNKALNADLAASNEKVEDLQKKYDALQQSIARQATVTQASANPLKSPTLLPASQATPQPAGQKSGSWMFDPNHVSPLGTPPPGGKKGK